VGGGGGGAGGGGGNLLAIHRDMFTKAKPMSTNRSLFAAELRLQCAYAQTIIYTITIQLRYLNMAL
jgi:hypothetical protein